VDSGDLTVWRANWGRIQTDNLAWTVGNYSPESPPSWSLINQQFAWVGANFSLANQQQFSLPLWFDSASATSLSERGVVYASTLKVVPSLLVNLSVNGVNKSGLLAGDGADVIDGGDDTDWLFGGGDDDSIDGGA